MYVELTANQSAALDSNQCPKCGSKDHMAKEWTRNGLTVRCNACKETINRPRGRAVANASGGGTAKAKATDGRSSQGQKAPPKDETPEQKADREAAEQAARDKEAQEEKEQYEKERQDMLDNMQRMVEKAVADKPAAVVKVEMKRDSTTTTNTVNNPHPLLTEVLRRVNVGIRNFLFVGPSGSGKTTILEQLAAALGFPYSVTPMSGGLTEGKLIGRITANGEFLTTAFLTAYEIPSVHNLDEFDKSDPNVPACIHSGIENGRLFLPDRAKATIALRDPMFILGATANTWGTGADMLYVGANQIDAAMKSRFAGGVFFVDYDTNLEAALVPEQPYRDIFWNIRKRHTEHRLRRIWGTRELIRGATLLRGGYSESECFTALTVGYTKDEMDKIGVRAT